MSSIESPEPCSNRRAGRLAIITGAGSGIGRAVAEALSREGVELVLVGRRAEWLHETARLCRSKTIVVPADVSQPLGRAAIVDATDGRPIDALVQLAGSMEFGELATLDRATWESSFATLVHARLYLIQDLLEQFRSSARLLQVGSRSGTRARRGAAAYCCAYAAALMLSHCLRGEWADRDLLITTFLPGSVDTPLLQKSIEVPRSLFPDGQGYADERSRGELIAPSTVAQFVSWLVLDAPASIYDQPLVAIDDRQIRSLWDDRSATGGGRVG